MKNNNRDSAIYQGDPVSLFPHYWERALPASQAGWEGLFVAAKTAK